MQESEVIKAANREIAIDAVDPAEIPTKSIEIINRALHGQTSLEDVQAMQSGLDLPGNEDIAHEIKTAVTGYNKAVQAIDGALTQESHARQRLADAEQAVQAISNTVVDPHCRCSP